MATKISLRVRLTIWYSAIIALSLTTFGLFTYFSVSKELNENLDTSLDQVANSLDFIIIQQREKKNNPLKKRANQQSNKKENDKFEIFRIDEENRFVGPLHPDSKKDDDDGSDKSTIWSAIYEHILMNPKNYFIQIADTNNHIIWRSQNLMNYTLPVLTKEFINFVENGDTTTFPYNIKPISKFLKLTKKNKQLDSVFTFHKINDLEVRLLVKKTEHAMISIGYTSDDIASNLKQLFSSLIISLPLILVVSIFGGLLLFKISLKSIDEITQTADEITASNLSSRLPEPGTNDEVAHLTRTLNRMIERLEASFVQIKQFTSDASHELRTPLTILTGELELALHKSKTDEEYQLVIASALEEVNRLTNVVETLLELSRAETGQVKINLEKSDLSKLINDIAEDAEILAESKDIQVIKNITPNIFTEFETARIHQAVLNIVDNAIKYSPKNKIIYIDLLQTNNKIIIKISDTGIGIPKEQLKYIFDRFYRVDKARSSDIQGSGLGLSIVKWILDAHNWNITVESTPDIGTSFTVTIPVK